MERSPSPNDTSTRPRGLRRSLIAAALVPAAVLLSLALGSSGVAPGDVISALLDYDPTGRADGIVIDERLPRTLIGLLAGVALGAAGCLMQSVTRNPIADPGLLGISAGAALAVVLAIQFLGVSAPAAFVPYAFAGGLAAAIIVYAVASGGRRASPLRLALAGAAFSALLGSLTTAVVLLDLQIGNMGGIAACLDLRLEQRAGRVPDCKALMLLDREADLFLARRAEADGWLVKPLDAFRLRRAVAAVLGSGTYTEGLPEAATAPTA